MKKSEDIFDHLVLLSASCRWHEFRAKLHSEPNIVKLKDKYGSNLLIEILPYAPLEILRDVILLGSDLSVVNKEGFSCLHKIIEELNPDDMEKFQLLIDSGADINSIGWNGWTPLHQAVAYDCLFYAKMLLEKGADSSIRTNIDDKETPLMIAKRKGNKKMQKLLKEEGGTDKIIS